MGEEARKDGWVNMGQGRGKVIRLYDKVQPTDLDQRLYFDPKYVYHPPDGRELGVADIPEKLRENLMKMDAMTNKHKKEILGIFDKEGNLLLSDFVIGGKDYVNITHSIKRLLWNSAGRYTVVHTHPTPRAFSSEDHSVMLQQNRFVGTSMVLARGNVLYSMDTTNRTSGNQPFSWDSGELGQRLNREFNQASRSVEAKWRQGAYDNRKGETFIDEGIEVRIGRTGSLRTNKLMSNQIPLSVENNELYAASRGFTMKTERLTPVNQNANIQAASATPRTSTPAVRSTPTRTTTPRTTQPTTPAPTQQPTRTTQPTSTASNVRRAGSDSSSTASTTPTPARSTTPAQPSTNTNLSVGDTITVRVGRKNQTVNITASALKQGYTYKTVNGVKYKVDIINKTSTRM